MKQYNIGSTLIEALLSVSMLSLGAIALINLETQLMQSNVATNQRAQALLLAETKIELLRNFSSLADYDAIASGSDNYIGKNTTYQRQWHITNYTNPNYKNINMTVSWPLRNGTIGSVTLTSRITGYEPATGGLTLIKLNTLSTLST